MQNTIEEVNDKLGKFRDSYIVITTKDELNKYIEQCNKNNIVSIDTETMGKNAMKDKLVGICLYTPNNKACYIPVNHASFITGDRCDNQLNEQDINEGFNKLNEDIDIIMFNASFDTKVLKVNCDIRLNCTWDCYLGARLLNENEKDNSLKRLHQKYVLNNQDDEYKFSELFDPALFYKVPIDTAYLYAAHDAIITYELYEFQRKYLNENSREDLRTLYNVMINSEMPTLKSVINMELVGVAFDKEYANQLSVKYTKLYNDKLDEINIELSKYENEIAKYKQTNSAKLDEPINILSSSQLSILLYDILKIQPVDKDKPRGTGEEILTKINLPLCKLILELRDYKKMLSTYIDKLPNDVNEKTGRIHCKFNQYGADTGRFSSSEPNLQNIPSHNTEIRQMFKATDGYVMMSSDYSQQEPKCLAALCRMAGDSQMYDVFMAGKDLYSDIASVSSEGKYSYEECREFNADGTTNKEGKERRKEAKSILLGVLYGRGDESIAEQLGCSLEEAKAIKQRVFKGYPAIKKFEQDTLNMARTKGYVTTI